MSQKIDTSICENFCESIIHLLNHKLQKYGKNEIKKQLNTLLKNTKWDANKVIQDLNPIIDELDKGDSMDMNNLSRALKKAANHKWIPGHPFFQAGTKKIFNKCAKDVDNIIKKTISLKILWHKISFDILCHFLTNYFIKNAVMAL